MEVNLNRLNRGLPQLKAARSWTSVGAEVLMLITVGRKTYRMFFLGEKTLKLLQWIQIYSWR